MEKLIKPVDYAQELGISRQAVYAKIKRGILRSKSVDGKLYIAIDQSGDVSEIPKQDDVNQPQDTHKKAKSKKYKVLENGSDNEALLKAKDETIKVLKSTVKDLKKSNKQIATTLRSEIDLLKEAFHEMRLMYATQIDHIKRSDFEISQKPIEVIAVDQEKWISLKKFFKMHKISKTKEQKHITKKLKSAYKKGDIRIVSKNGVIELNKREDFTDIIE